MKKYCVVTTDIYGLIGETLAWFDTWEEADAAIPALAIEFEEEEEDLEIYKP